MLSCVKDCYPFDAYLFLFICLFAGMFVLLIHVSNIWIYVMSCVQPASWPAILRGRNFNTGHSMQTFQSLFFIPAMLIGTIDFYHFLPLSLALTLPGSHKVSAKQNLLASFFCTLFSWSEWNEIWSWSNSSWTYWYCFWVKFNETWEITAVLLAAS